MQKLAVSQDPRAHCDLWARYTWSCMLRQESFFSLSFLQSWANWSIIIFHLPLKRLVCLHSSDSGTSNGRRIGPENKFYEISERAEQLSSPDLGQHHTHDLINFHSMAVRINFTARTAAQPITVPLAKRPNTYLKLYGHIKIPLPQGPSDTLPSEFGACNRIRLWGQFPRMINGIATDFWWGIQTCYLILQLLPLFVFFPIPDLVPPLW